MKRVTMLWAAGIGLLTLIIAASNLNAAVDEKTNAAINKIADLLEKGDLAAAKKAATVLAADTDTEDFMNAFKLRSKKGIGIGPKANEVMPDGIEQKIEAIAKEGITPAALKKDSIALARAGHVMSAVAHVAHAKAPEKDFGKMKRADWILWSEGLAK